MKGRIWRIGALLGSLCFALKAQAGIVTSCHGPSLVQTIAHLNLKDFFPLTIGSVTVEAGKLPDTDNPKNPLCTCGDFPDFHIGASVGYWEPMALIDVTRTPYCLVNFNGLSLGGDSQSQGSVDTQDPDQNSAFFYVHYYSFPLAKWLFGELLGGSCTSDEAFKVPYFSELDPIWRNENLASQLFPDEAVIAQSFQYTPLAALGANAACGTESAKLALGLLPIDSLFWCAGSQGMMYPLTGKTAEANGMAEVTTLMSERAVFLLHHLFLISDTSPSNLCKAAHRYMMQKSRYRCQMIYPVQGPAAPFGKSTMGWESRVNLSDLAKGDDAAFLIWRKRNCCSY